MTQYTLTRPIYDYLRQYEWLRRVYRESRTALHITRNRLQSVRSGSFGIRQRRKYLGSIPAYDLNTVFASDEQLLQRCDECDIRYSTGRHAIYLPPQAGLSDFLGDIVDDFPAEAGFKILRNFKAPSEASYITNGDQRRLTQNMMGSVTNQALAANALAALDLGPPCYAVAHLRSGSQDMTAFVVQHVEGDLASAEDCEEFVGSLRKFITDGLFELVPVRGLKDPDFLPPHCNFNLLRERSTGKLRYIDFSTTSCVPKTATE